MAAALQTILISYFTNLTLREFMVAPTMVHSDKISHKCDNNTIIVFINIDTSAIAGVATLGGKMMRHHPLDIDIYSGENARYNSYEAPIKRLNMLTHPLPLSDVKLMCGISDRYIGNCNIHTVRNISHVKPFITAKPGILTPDEKLEIERRYRRLIMSLV